MYQRGNEEASRGCEQGPSPRNSHRRLARPVQQTDDADCMQRDIRRAFHRRWEAWFWQGKLGYEFRTNRREREREREARGNLPSFSSVCEIYPGLSLSSGVCSEVHCPARRMQGSDVTTQVKWRCLHYFQFES